MWFKFMLFMNSISFIYLMSFFLIKPVILFHFVWGFPLCMLANFIVIFIRYAGGFHCGCQENLLHFYWIFHYWIQGQSLPNMETYTKLARKLGEKEMVLTAVDTLGYCSGKHRDKKKYLFLIEKKNGLKNLKYIGMVSRMSGTAAFRVHFRILCIYLQKKILPSLAKKWRKQDTVDFMCQGLSDGLSGEWWHD